MCHYRGKYFFFDHVFWLKAVDEYPASGVFCSEFSKTCSDAGKEVGTFTLEAVEVAFG
jgi:hypothetical protein